MAHTFTITISDEELKAMNLIVPDADQWVTDAVKSKARKTALRAVGMILSDLDNTLLPADRTTLNQYLVDNDLVLVPYKDWPINTLKLIVEKTILPSRADRDLAEQTP
jgi:hypothetical protein